LNANRKWQGALVAALYFIVALVFTWPLARGLTRDIPWDLGDSLLNCWILQWDIDHLARFLSGDLGAFRGFWTANIFYPEPLTLAYSEHLFAEAVQIFPVYLITHNIILCYNVLFLSTFVLSGLGMFLFVREVTGSSAAGFASGLMYAFAPLRLPQFAHVQVLSSQWMPFVLYGLRRYFDTRRPKPLALAGLALVAQNLSCGYFLMFFAPCALVYVLFEIASRRLWLDWKVWVGLATTGVAVALVTLPFLLPYLELRRLGFPARSLIEVESYSADVYSYWTAPSESRLWGRLVRAFPKSEGDLFPSFSALTLALVGFAASVRLSWERARGDAAVYPIFTIFVYVVTAGCALYTLFLILILTGHGFAEIGVVPISVRSLARNFQILLVAVVVLLLTSPRARSFAHAWSTSLAGTVAVLALLAFLLSLGPEIRTMGRALHGTPPYAAFYWHVPGFDGLRVPARYGMLTMLFLSPLAGFGIVQIEKWLRRGALVGLAVGFFAVAEAFAAPIVVNGTDPVPGYVTPESRVYVGREIPRVYDFLKTLPSDTVVAEFPIGEWGYELRYVFYSATHWHPLINGYSGTFPLSYTLRAAALHRPDEDPDRAWDSLIESGATHVVVHEAFYRDGRGSATSGWLKSRGARLVAEFQGDKVFAVR